MWIKDGTVYLLHADIRRAVGPRIGLPAVITDAVLAEQGFAPVEDVAPPEAANNEAVEEVAPEQIGGVWKRKYLKRTLTAEEFDARRQAKARDMRDKRDRLLAESDWTQLLDTPAAVQTAWAAYRVLVRDVTKQAGFPFDVEWPVKP